MYEFIKGQGWVFVQGKPIKSREYSGSAHYNMRCILCNKRPGEHYSGMVADNYLHCEYPLATMGLFTTPEDRR